MGCGMLARYSFAQHPPLTFEMLCGLEFRGPPSPSEQGGCEHGRPARQTVHSVWNWFWNDLLGNPVGLE